MRLEQLPILRVKLVGSEHISTPQQPARQHGASRILRDRAVRLSLATPLEIGLENFRDVLRKLCAEQPADAVSPFARLLGFLAAEIVEPRTGMRIDDAERRRLLFQMLDDERENRML